ncbi:MAG: Asp-tRNA(Asn)/Glu-tRNA(Gln) amidotransferase subunit GatC [Lactobacillaceae bacterium]|nr:Asp-tRNA(Asn)/Glu-tRNA(Gln) amidotransferase subunit GatC [Lactobacillaceae bacterium]
MANQELESQEVLHVAELAKLALSPQETEKFTTQLGKIFHLVDLLAEVDTDGVKPTYSVTEMRTVLREDVAVNAQQADALLANAPEHEGTSIKVPSILD